MDAKSRISIGFTLIYALFLVLFALCIGSIVGIQYIKGDVWHDIGKTIKSAMTPRTVEPLRGSIYCYNMEGQKEVVAASMKVYKIYFNGVQLRAIEKDLRARNKKFSCPDSVARLASLLSSYFGDASASQYSNIINRAYNTKKRVLLISRNIDYLERKDIMKFPLLNSAGGKYNDCMISEEVNRRIHPYGNLALRTIGDVFTDRSQKTDGRFGIELQFDSLLRGIEGTSNPLKISRRRTVFDEYKRAVNGADITLTLNIDMQDIVQSCLMEQAQKLGIERGCAVLMEVATGEIKAISNLYYSPKGYFEAGNMAISDLNPPGSTFKTLTMLVALEDGTITPDTIVDAFNKQYPKVADHDSHPEWSAITASDMFVYSSNVGISNVIGNRYGNNPMQFVRAIQKTKVDEPFDIGLPGATGFKIGYMRYWNIKDTISKIDLPTMSFGYQVAVPPIYMLRFYNAIANNGKMINPFIVKEINNNGKITTFSTKTVNSSIASSRTIGQLKTMLRKVVEQKGGTGYAYRSSKVSFAGKTGTAVFMVNGISTDQVSFCGYFPADKPKYSCIVVMQRQGIWGAQSCEVFRNIAEKIVSLNTTIDVGGLQDTVKYLPTVKNGRREALRYILRKLNISSDFADSEWLIVHRDSLRIRSTELPLVQNLVPNVVGMGAKDAVCLMERSGLRVHISGRGTVRQQSLAAGSRVVKGQTVRLVLN